MKGLMVAAFTVFALVTVVLGIPRSHSVSSVGRADMASSSTLHELQGGAAKLPAEDFDDRSLVFPRETTR
ncbi:hypothetical protein [Bradyrhizobium septentrionale]|uniref:Uncharacterized protein n=1 Tax=Bradyrhizobium septentrionale TaxID=1404411 RepID=A0A973VZF3_9BRAD|nr:hypothetical protein [Bradyrhizobium septentrionale]UGY13500.1 hypothetical protein HAP48_0033670 [Bradyrhizobium septentrionale]UGY22141.1 hypothetical protein HU675_0029620 [Bradyrhizobium septentrionale]